MKRNLHSGCLIFLFFFFFIVGLAGLVNADGGLGSNNTTIYLSNNTTNGTNNTNTTSAIMNIDINDYIFNYTTIENITSGNATNENTTNENAISGNETNENTTSGNATYKNTTNENTTIGNSINGLDYELLIYGYTNKSYIFGVTSKISVPSNISQDNFINDTNVIALWDAIGDKSKCDVTSLRDAKLVKDPEDNSIVYTSKFSHIWNESGKYAIQIGTLPKNGIFISSFSIPIRILEHAKVPSFDMLEEKKEFDGTNTNNSYNYNNSTKYYCAYENNKYDFCATLNGSTKNSGESARPMIVVDWGDGRLDYIPYSNNSNNGSTVFYNCSHDWSKTGSQNMKVGVVQLDSFHHNFDPEIDLWNNKSVLIIRDPKNFIDPKNFLVDPSHSTIRSSNISEDSNNSTVLQGPPSNNIASELIKPLVEFKIRVINPLFGFINQFNGFIIKIINSLIVFTIGRFSNLQNLGITLATAGLMILILIYPKNIVPVKISLLGRKPLDQKSVDSFIGIVILVTGLYLYFVFGRCPWDIPIVSDSISLSNIYFCMLYYEYANPLNGLYIPYLSILLGLIVVIISSIIIYRIGIPFLKGESKSGRFFREILRGERSLLPQSGTQQFSVQLKEHFTLLKEKIMRISLTDQKRESFPSKSGKQEEILRSPKT